MTNAKYDAEQRYTHVPTKKLSPVLLLKSANKQQQRKLKKANIVVRSNRGRTVACPQSVLMLWCDAQNNLIQRLTGDIWIATCWFLTLLHPTQQRNSLKYTCYSLTRYEPPLHSNFFTVKYFLSPYQPTLICFP